MLANYYRRRLTTDQVFAYGRHREKPAGPSVDLLSVEGQHLLTYS